ncbi:abortive infection family protein [Mumia zhuanghuii]|uniref:Abortive infection protein-like C-terminal domain-containing protein n=1 Tax=Mumia zhuanghuii TaxID=2585211 RepID=A0A5C4N200_9ACTN|nr:abortive infection family protein [Mumia zhuanghuii]TNC51411.1 hypothetical protein FHE65_01800 [Mumia zhuanghuii]
MNASAYSRFDVTRPPLLAQEYWASIESELLRLERSLTAGDDIQVIGDAKCLVEATAKVAWDINGTPADSNASFPTVVTRAHELLRNQPGQELAHQSTYAALALQASRMAGNLAEIRNAIGGGHGRARKPYVRAEEVDLALDGALTWVRWALRRLDLFAEGRPDQLIRDLVGSDTEPQKIFTQGLLARRLVSANLPQLEPKWQRSLGVAVGQRSASGTFVVSDDGLSPAVESQDLAVWPTQYRLGLAQGCLFDRDEQPTIWPATLVAAVKVLAPVTNGEIALDELVDRVVAHYVPVNTGPGQLADMVREVEQAAAQAAGPMQPPLRKLEAHLRAVHP